MKFWIKLIVSVILIGGIGGYAIFQARKLIEGPELTITSPINGIVVHDDLVNIIGVAKNIREITLNDRPIFVDENGNFREKLLLYPGYNIIKLQATDKFGKQIKKEIQNVFIDSQ